MSAPTIGQALDLLADRDPDRVALRVPGVGGPGGGPAGGAADEVLTRDALRRASIALARRWRADGLAPDDLVTLCLPPSAAFVVACVAAWRAGATPQPLSPDLPPAERAAVLRVARPALVVDRPPAVPVPGELASLPPLPDDLAAASWKAPTSSGSTGRPKLVLATDPARVDPDGVVAPFVPREAVQLVAAPVHHAAAFVYALRGLMTGHELVVMPRFDPVAWLDLVARHRATWSVLSPATMRRIARVPDHATGWDVSSLASVLHLGARCAPDLKRHWLDWLGPDRVVEVYAGTEAQGLTMVTGPEWLARPGTVGRPVAGSRVQVVRPDGTSCAPGEVGEVLLSRGRPTYAYRGGDRPTAEVSGHAGWHTQGDLGWLDADGWLFLADRADDALVVDGHRVLPTDVEEVLEAHPAVRSALVVGRPDPDAGGSAGGTVHAVVDVGGGPPGSTGTEGVDRVDGVDGVDEAALVDVLAGWVAARLPGTHHPRTWQLVHEPLRSDAGKARRRDWR